MTRNITNNIKLIALKFLLELLYLPLEFFHLYLTRLWIGIPDSGFGIRVFSSNFENGSKLGMTLAFKEILTTPSTELSTIVR